MSSFNSPQPDPSSPNTGRHGQHSGNTTSPSSPEHPLEKLQPADMLTNHALRRINVDAVNLLNTINSTVFSDWSNEALVQQLSNSAQNNLRNMRRDFADTCIALLRETTLCRQESLHSLHAISDSLSSQAARERYRKNITPLLVELRAQCLHGFEFNDRYYPLAIKKNAHASSDSQPQHILQNRPVVEPLFQDHSRGAILATQCKRSLRTHIIATLDSLVPILSGEGLASTDQFELNQACLDVTGFLPITRTFSFFPCNVKGNERCFNAALLMVESAVAIWGELALHRSFCKILSPERAGDHVTAADTFLARSFDHLMSYDENLFRKTLEVDASGSATIRFIAADPLLARALYVSYASLQDDLSLIAGNLRRRGISLCAEYFVPNKEARVAQQGFGVEITLAVPQAEGDEKLTPSLYLSPPPFEYITQLSNYLYTSKVEALSRYTPSLRNYSFERTVAGRKVYINAPLECATSALCLPETRRLFARIDDTLTFMPEVQRVYLEFNSRAGSPKEYLAMFEAGSFKVHFITNPQYEDFNNAARAVAPLSERYIPLDPSPNAKHQSECLTLSGNCFYSLRPVSALDKTAIEVEFFSYLYQILKPGVVVTGLINPPLEIGHGYDYLGLFHRVSQRLELTLGLNPTKLPTLTFSNRGLGHLSSDIHSAQIHSETEVHTIWATLIGDGATITENICNLAEIDLLTDRCIEALRHCSEATLVDHDSLDILFMENAVILPHAITTEVVSLANTKEPRSEYLNRVCDMLLSLYFDPTIIIEFDKSYQIVTARNVNTPWHIVADRVRVASQLIREKNDFQGGLENLQ